MALVMGLVLGFAIHPEAGFIAGIAAGGVWLGIGILVQRNQ